MSDPILLTCSGNPAIDALIEQINQGVLNSHDNPVVAGADPSAFYYLMQVKRYIGIITDHPLLVMEGAKDPAVAEVVTTLLLLVGGLEQVIEQSGKLPPCICGKCGVNTGVAMAEDLAAFQATPEGKMMEIMMKLGQIVNSGPGGLPSEPPSLDFGSDLSDDDTEGDDDDSDGGGWQIH
jgi:hypothetical protein